jgi:hypothetical protein
VTWIRAWRWDAEHGLVSVVLRVERDAARRGGWFSAAAQPSAGETLSWLERSRSMCAAVVRLNEASVLRHQGKGGQSVLPHLT